MKKKTSLTIGIPAYNEEQNVAVLVRRLLKQNFKDLTLEKILVVSDGSTDKTVYNLNQIKNKKLTVVDRKERLGAMRTQNQILKNCNSDILVMLDADVIPDGKNFIQEIVLPIKNNSCVGLVGANIVSIKGESWFEKIIANSNKFKKSMYMLINNGDNLYMCHGRARAFAKKFYKKLSWVNESPEDAFSYLACVSSGFMFKYAPNAKVLFRSPKRYEDHKKQSVRFEIGKQNVLKHFDEELVRASYDIPFATVLSQFIKHFLINPINMSAFVFLKTYLYLKSKTAKMDLSTWDMAMSTKRII